MYIWIVMYVDELCDPQLCQLGYIGAFSSFQKAKSFAIAGSDVVHEQWTSRVEYRISGFNNAGAFLVCIRRERLL